MFPDVELLAQTFLNGLLTPPVVVFVPNPRPALFVRVFRTGGTAVNRVLERAQISYEAWGGDTVSASNLARDVRHAFLNDYTDMPLVRGVNEITGTYFDPDPDTNLPRYSGTVELMVRAHF